MAIKGKTIGKRKATSTQVNTSFPNVSQSSKSDLDQGSFKKAKLSTKEFVTAKTKSQSKEHAYDKQSIPIPIKDSDSTDSELSEEELGFFAENAEAAGTFLAHLDVKGIARYVPKFFYR